jgi:hypothetical protein
MCLSNFHVLFILQASETLHDVVLSIVNYLLMLGGRTNTNLFPSPLPANEMFPRTISVEHDITTGRRDQGRESARAKEEKLAVLSRFVLLVAYVYTSIIYSSSNNLSMVHRMTRETNVCVTGSNQSINSTRARPMFDGNRCENGSSRTFRIMQWLHVSSIFYTR